MSCWIRLWLLFRSLVFASSLVLASERGDLFHMSLLGLSKGVYGGFGRRTLVFKSTSGTRPASLFVRPTYHAFGPRWSLCVFPLKAYEPSLRGATVT